MNKLNSLEEIVRHYSESEESAENIIDSLKFNGFINKAVRRFNEKEVDKILKKFYEHMCGVDDYGCKLCLKYKQQILDLQKEK